MFRPARAPVFVLVALLGLAATPLLAQDAPAPVLPAPVPSAPALPAPALPAPSSSGPAVAMPEIAQPQAGPAGGSSCDKDFQKLSNARLAQIGALNHLSKVGKGKMDPIAACSKLQGLAGIEARMVAYVEKNKDWCGIPDSVADSIRKGRQNTVAFAGKACGAASNFRKQLAQRNAQQRAAANGAAPQQGSGPQVQKLPTGPL